MEIILKANVPYLGKMLDVVKVKDGYARNYLFPKKLAIRATPEAKKEIERNRAAMEAQFQKELAAAGDMAAKLSLVTVNMTRRVVEGERLYGSVSAADIAEAITLQGIKISRGQVQLEEPIKQLGVYSVTVNVFSDITATVKVWVVAEN
ncbi:MAG: 50S ribosomal protein L9 [Fibrobacteraceae bacterium]|jgi:large subunit ribosomal protein L9|nr:50S ribosomal protein L9 [Fibrobacteraceae bacterium]MBQ5611568.1 50S ribosomal protein L9 [Fibrobacteraceae bacterium]